MPMMLFAGADVSVTLKGRLIRGGTIEGFVMPYEQPLEAELAYASTGTKMQGIEQLQALVLRMHAKAFSTAISNPTTEATAPRERTTAYQSPWRCRSTKLPLCKQDDLYALGVSESGRSGMARLPFDPEKHEYLDQDIADGLQPNLDEVDDATVRGLIERYLKLRQTLRLSEDSERPVPSKTADPKRRLLLTKHATHCPETWSISILQTRLPNF
ncbi:hypothetical protein EXIGLDRAFT_830668 [Exidia glandulosa HHB12029]|uniref:Uncharacterized protein n=1 Tax=Exidia glandulosa HHB12029 TaxID=1314781 RepID=A0A165NBM9_EXIGL|nr:hypothetical protein EXIGLDRAFT_830668 [Exidia glandulosa HHB12029]